jgi:hypothetical protein
LTILAISLIGCITPVSLLAYITDTRAPSSNLAKILLNASISKIPLLSTGQTIAALLALKIESCSTAEITTEPIKRCIIVLLDSVAPEVKIT